MNGLLAVVFPDKGASQSDFKIQSNTIESINENHGLEKPGSKPQT